jgi:hypothetical protein
VRGKLHGSVPSMPLSQDKARRMSKQREHPGCEKRPNRFGYTMWYCLVCGRTEAAGHSKIICARRLLSDQGLSEHEPSRPFSLPALSAISVDEYTMEPIVTHALPSCDEQCEWMR